MLNLVAGADISEMAPKEFAECYKENYLEPWTSMFRSFKKPVIAAVNGFAVQI